MDDIITGGAIPERAIQLKKIVIATFKEAGFKLQKWKSNISEVENESLVSPVDAEQTYAKSQLGNDTYDTKILGLTKRGIIQKLAPIYDPLGIASPVTLYGFKDWMGQRVTKTTSKEVV